MLTYLFRNPRSLILTVILLLVFGLLSLYASPRMEDPLLTPRAATITTLLPGSDAERVESLVTDKIEAELKEVEEIKEMNSVSRQSVSFIAVELKDEVTAKQVSEIWTRVRDKIEDARVELPTDATEPEFENLDIKAYALIVGLKWELNDQPRYGVLRRLIEELKDEIDSVTGTEQSDIFGDPDEEIIVSVRPDVAAAMNLRTSQISDAIFSSDSKKSAGSLRSISDDMLLEVSGELDTVTRLSHVPIQLGTNGTVVELADIATIEKSIRRPLNTKVLLDDKSAVALGVYVQSDIRLDQWRASLQPLLDRYAERLPPGVSLDVVFDQNKFVNKRMQSLTSNFFYGLLAVFIVNLLMLGWRSAWIVSLTMPLCVLAVFFLMRLFSIPIHQMSVTGLIISMGLIVDNAIVIVDEVAKKLKERLSREQAVLEATMQLAVPLLGATITTVISFGPIALMSGPSGEFVGAIAIVAILSVITSLVIALTIVLALAGILLKNSNSSSGWVSSGIGFKLLTRVYSKCLVVAFRFPMLGMLIGTAVCVAGFFCFTSLPDQFFPPADRNQFHIELRLSGTGALAETEEIATKIRAELLKDPAITQVAWFLGESAPPFYYNIIPDTKNASRFGQAIVDCRDDVDTQQIIRRTQSTLNALFPEVSVLAKQLEQGPPFSAPIEVQIFGPDAEQLKILGEQVRLVMSSTPDIIQTRSDFSEALPKITFEVDERQARLAGLDHSTIADEMRAMLEGTTGGSILESSEELPVRVRVSDDRRGDINKIASIDLVGVPQSQSGDTSLFQGVPISAIASLQLTSESAGISRLNGARMNEVQAFIPAGVLPLVAQKDFEKRLAASDFQLPEGYSMQFAGAQAERNDALNNLIVNGILLFVTMIAVLVVTLKSFRMTLLLFLVAGLSVGAGIGSLWIADLNWGFMGLVGIMGMIGIAVNDSIVVIAALNRLTHEQVARPTDVAACIVENTRHVLATTLTTVAGFTPLILAGGQFWPPVAVTISGGVLAATLLAILFVPSFYLLFYGLRRTKSPQIIRV